MNPVESFRKIDETRIMTYLDPIRNQKGYETMKVVPMSVANKVLCKPNGNILCKTDKKRVFLFIYFSPMRCQKGNENISSNPIFYTHFESSSIELKKITFHVNSNKTVCKIGENMAFMDFDLHTHKRTSDTQ